MSDPYRRGLVQGNPYAARRSVSGVLVAVMDMELTGRGLQLMHVPSRALQRGEVHELIVTHEEAEVGGTVNDVAYLGFFEVERGGVVRRGDVLRIDEATVATLVGFDETHAPNHLNIVFRTETPATGTSLDLQLEQAVTFVDPQQS